MEAKELMIGDWVECVDSTHKKKVYAQIDAIEEGQTCILVRLDNCNWFLDISFIKPIPLTPEILEKNGIFKRRFKGHVEECYSATANPISNEQFILWEETDRFELVLRHIVDNLTYSALRCKVKYIHELQHALMVCEIEKEIVL